LLPAYLWHSDCLFPTRQAIDSFSTFQVEGIETGIELILVSLLFVGLLAIVKFAKGQNDSTLTSPEWRRKSNAYRWERRSTIR